MLFTPKKPLWTVKEIGTELGLTQSMVYRYVALLREVGLLDGDDSSKAYRVTDLVRPLADAAEATREPIGKIGLPWMTRLRDEFNETAFVERRSGWFAYVMERVESFHPVRLIFERGQAVALHQGPSARLLLSELSYADRARYFEFLGVDRTRYNPELLSDDALDLLNRKGVAEGNEESGEGLWSVSAAIRSDRSTIMATIGVAAPLFRVSARQRQAICKKVATAAEEISELILNPAARPSAPQD